MVADPIERRLVAVLSADAVGYSRLMAADPDATVRTIGAYRQQIGLLVSSHAGRVVDSPGDNVLAEFGSVTGAAECALELQRVLSARNAALPDERRMVFRVGLHLAEILVEDGRIYGDGVNIAARLEALAEAGGVLCSATIRDQLRSHRGIGFESIGDQSLKNIPDPVHAYQMVSRQNVNGVADPASQTPSIAVLPFDNVGGDPEQEYFADGISEDLITDLCGVPGLLVTSRNSAFVYKGRRTVAKEVGRELGVQYLLEGSVRRSGNRLRITAQLVDAASGKHTWAQRYDRELADYFTVQDEVTREIVAALRIHIGDRAQPVPTGDLEAYDLYLRAMAYFHRFDREGVTRARELFQAATRRDPDFALAHARLGDTYTMEHAVWAPDDASLDKGIALIEKALALDPNEPEALVHLSRAHWFKGDYEASAREAKRALEVRPGIGFAHENISRALRSLGRFEEAVLAAETEIRLDPHNATARMERAAVAYFQCRYDEALSDALWSIQRAPDFLPSYLIMASCYSALARPAEAAAAIAEILRIAPNYSLGHMNRQVPGADFDGRMGRELLRAGLPA